MPIPLLSFFPSFLSFTPPPPSLLSSSSTSGQPLLPTRRTPPFPLPSFIPSTLTFSSHTHTLSLDRHPHTFIQHG